MKTQKNGILAITILVLMLTTTLMAGMQLANAAVNTTFQNYTFITASPNPVGVNQNVLVVLWLSEVPAGMGGGPTGWKYEGITVKITKPDGTSETMGPYVSDDVASVWFAYTPTAVGTYYLQAHYAGNQWINTSTTNTLYLPSDSNKFELIVQQERIPDWPSVPLPTSYWTRPIYGTNREWAPISGNWLMTAFNKTARAFDSGCAFAPLNGAPKSAHILWKRPLTFGGLIGGEYGSTSFYAGMSYEQMFKPPIIISGYLYYNKPTPPRYGFYCVDMETGETVWYNNDTTITYGQIFDYESPNQHGGIAYLWSVSGSSTNQTWKMYDAWTGNWILSIVNMTSGTTMFGPSGEMLVYSLSGGNMTLWNSTLCIPTAGATGTSFWQWRPEGTRITSLNRILDGKNGIQWNKNVSVAGQMPTPTTIKEITDGVIYLGYGPRGSDGTIAVSMTGQVLWYANITKAANVPHTGPPANVATPVGNGIQTEWIKEALQWIGYDMRTGTEVWRTAPFDNPWAMFATGNMIAYGNFYTSGYDGTIRVFNVTTGKLQWTYSSGNAGTEMPYGTWPMYNGLTIADGILFATNGEHSTTQPFPRGERLHAIDAYTGKSLWNITGLFKQPAVADGKLVSYNEYDNMIYCFGKGPSATTVTVSPKVSVHGNSVLIEGSVTDQTPLQKGTAAVSDESMSAWMEYLHMQQPMPANVKGVEVILETLDPNNNFYEIGRATTDANGNFGYTWKPEVPGQYMVIATFTGSNSYGSSQATTYVSVAEAPPSSPPPEYPQPIDNTMTIVGMGIAIIIAIAIVGLILIKKK